MDTGRSGEAAKALELVAANLPWRWPLQPVASGAGDGDDRRSPPAAGAGKFENKRTVGTALHSRVFVPRRFVRCNLRLLSRLENHTPIPRFAASVPGVFHCSFHALAGRITSAVSTSWAAFSWAGEPDSLPEH